MPSGVCARSVDADVIHPRQNDVIIGRRCYCCCCCFARPASFVPRYQLAARRTFFARLVADCFDLLYT